MPPGSRTTFPLESENGREKFEFDVSIGKMNVKKAKLQTRNKSEFISNVERKLREQAKMKAEEDVQKEKQQLDELRRVLDFERSELDKFRSELDSIPADIPLESLSNMVEAPKATNTENSNVTERSSKRVVLPEPYSPFIIMVLSIIAIGVFDTISR